MPIIRLRSRRITHVPNLGWALVFSDFNGPLIHHYKPLNQKVQNPRFVGERGYGKCGKQKQLWTDSWGNNNMSL